MDNISNRLLCIKITIVAGKEDREGRQWISVLSDDFILREMQDGSKPAELLFSMHCSENNLRCMLDTCCIILFG